MARRRLLLVHLFLPDTLEFQDWPDEQSISHYRVPSQAKGDGEDARHSMRHDVPPSPPTLDVDGEGHNLSFEDLDDRLKQASISSEQRSRRSRQSDDGDDGRSSADPERSTGQQRRGKGEDDEDALSDSSESEATAQAMAAKRQRSAASRPHSNRGSFSEQSRKVNMTSLMSEAASGGRSDSRRGSLSALSAVRPTLTVGSDESPIPVAPSSDHGRAATTVVTPAQGTTNGTPSTGLANRRGSAGAGTGLQRPTLGSLNSSSPSSLDKPKFDNAGTRTPGAHAGGKAGTMTPLSIIGDLKAKRSALPTQTLPTLGDTDRHHPFGSGVVTPLREGPPVTGGSRTPGPRPTLSSLNSFARSSASGLTLTKVNEPPRPTDRATGQRTPHAKANAVDLSQPSRSFDDFITNDHGRNSVGGGAPLLSKPVRPAALSRSNTQGTHPNAPLRALVDDNETHTPFAKPPSQSSRRPSAQLPAGTPMSVRPQTGIGAASGSGTQYSRSSSKARQMARQSFIGRRPSSIGSRSNLNRRLSSDTYTMEEYSPVYGDEDEQLKASPMLLPPYDFVPNPSSNGGLVNAVRSLTEERLRGGKVFIGMPGVTTDEWLGKREQEVISQRMRQERDSLPVWLDEDTFEGAYTDFCKQILWPTFHYTLPTRKGLDYEHEGFECYRHLNEKFAKAIIQEYKEGDIIFINDYHLLLVPEMVREKLPHSKICFFLHIAWPSSEIFRCLSARTHILKGMLGADLVGFQTANFARHFRQTVSRILQLEATPKGIQIDGRGGFVTVGVFPIGIDVERLNERRRQPDVLEWVEKLQSRYDGKKIIVGRDKLDSIKGVRQKLLAFETALNEHRDLLGKVVLLQVALATTEENEEVAAATEVVSRINNKYSTLTYQPVVFLHVQDITFCQYLALLTVADAFLATSLREGMNLTTHEFVICQEVRHKPLILSEFTGTYSSLRACIGINPWNTKQVADAIFKAIMMDENEAFERWKDLYRQVTTQDAQHWIQSLLGRLERAHIDQQRRNNIFVPRLEIGQSEWRASKSRLILLDLEGTLMVDDPLHVHENGFEPPEHVIRILLDLTDDAKNRVYVLSGLGARDLTKLVRRVPRLGLVAENGCSVMYAGSAPNGCFPPSPANAPEDGKTNKTWTSLVTGTNMSWRDSVKEILLYFTERTPGSWLEDRGASILWWFWSKDADGKIDAQDKKDYDWARRQAAEVQNLIYDSLGERFSLRIIPAKTSFLIMPKNTSRATATQHIVSLSHVGVRHGLHPAKPKEPATKPASPPGSMPSLTSAMQQVLAPSSSKDDEQDDEAERCLEAKELEAVRSPLAMLSPPILDSTTSSIMDLSAAKTFRQPSNAWSMNGDGVNQRSQSQASAATRERFLGAGDDRFGSQNGGRVAYNAHALHPYGVGSFDLVLCVGQDDGLFSYINSLDLPFAPVTCTSAGSDGADMSVHGHVDIGSEANYYADGPQDVLASLNEILAFRGRDQRWGVPAMVDV